MFETLGTSGSSHDDLDVLWEAFRKPEGNVGLFSSVAVNELVHTFDNDDNLVVNLLRTVNHKLFFDLSTADIEPISKELSDIFFE